MARIKIDLWAKDEAGDTRSAVKVMHDLGIKYGIAEPFPMGDAWVFGGVDVATVPEDRPAWVEVLK